jgi:hypothetical protein
VNERALVVTHWLCPASYKGEDTHHLVPSIGGREICRYCKKSATELREHPPTTWRVERMSGFKISHPFIVVDPLCPPTRHPTRDCGCTVFRTLPKATEYAETKTKEATHA